MSEAVAKLSCLLGYVYVCDAIVALNLVKMTVYSLHDRTSNCVMLPGKNVSVYTKNVGYDMVRLCCIKRSSYIVRWCIYFCIFTYQLTR